MSRCQQTLIAITLCIILRVESIAWYGSHFVCQGRNICYNDKFHCDHGVPCTIDCNGPNACQNSVVSCPIGGDCNIQCRGGYDACKELVVLAKQSKSLSVDCDVNEDEACDRQILYCPENGNAGSFTTHISGISAINLKANMKIFAIEGLGDVEISGDHLNYVEIYCKSDYSSTCTMKGSFTQCIESNLDKTCESYLQPTVRPANIPAVNPPSNQPTSSPTLRPSLFPSTSKPTLNPSQMPSTSKPTLYPTLSPILITPKPSPQPTQLFVSNSPSTFPTMSPTMRPTSSPSEQPSNNPSPAPTKLPTLSPTIRSFDDSADRTGHSKTTSKAPTVSPSFSPHPTRQTKHFNLETTSNDYAMNVIELTKDSNLINEAAQKSGLSPLHYVIIICLTFICLVSCLLFVWVTYTNKFNKNQNDPSKEEHAFSAVANKDDENELVLFEERDGAQMVILRKETNSKRHKRFASASLASATTAPTSEAGSDGLTVSGDNVTIGGSSSAQHTALSSTFGDDRKVDTMQQNELNQSDEEQPFFEEEEDEETPSLLGGNDELISTQNHNDGEQDLCQEQDGPIPTQPAHLDCVINEDIESVDGYNLTTEQEEDSTDEELLQSATENVPLQIENTLKSPAAKHKHSKMASHSRSSHVMWNGIGSLSQIPVNELDVTIPGALAYHTQIMSMSNTDHMQHQNKHSMSIGYEYVFNANQSRRPSLQK